MTTRRGILGAALTLPASGLPSGTALAQPAWPERPVRFVVAFAPGGFADLIGRMLGEYLAETWRHPVIVENRGGAGGNVAAQQIARANADGAGAALAQAERDRTRAEALAKRGFMARAQLEAVRTRAATAAAALAQGQAEIERLRAQLADPTGAAGRAEVPVRSSASGTVLSVLRQGDSIVPEGTELISIGNPADIEVVVDLLSRDAVRVQPGARVEFSQWGGDTPLIGAVQRIEPLGRLKVSALGIEEQRVNLIIGFAAGAARQAARLGHGFQLEATVVLWQAPAVLRVPIGALFRGNDGGWRVFVIDAGRARARAVQIGHINDEYGEALAGLAAGEKLVLNPGSQIAEGTRVRPR